MLVTVLVFEPDVEQVLELDIAHENEDQHDHVPLGTQARTPLVEAQVAATAAPHASWTSHFRKHRPATHALASPFCVGHAFAALQPCVHNPGPCPCRSQVRPAAQSALDRHGSPTNPIDPGTQASTARVLP